jgi:NADH pyrophosphatase NudC (nudix superfamily)
MEAGESLEETFCREVKEETGLTVIAEPNRWLHPTIIELPNRIIFVGEAFIEGDEPAVDGGDLYDVGWFRVNDLPKDLSPLIAPFLKMYLAKQ